MTRARSEDVDHEASTEQPAPQTHARISQANGNQGRAACVEAPTGQGKKTAHGVGRGGVARLARAAEIRRVFEAGRRGSRGPLTVIGVAAGGRGGSLGAIRLYRLVVSPVLPPACRFLPTCSAYAMEAIERHGTARGAWLAMRRLLRSHPFHAGGSDPLP